METFGDADEAVASAANTGEVTAFSATDVGAIGDDGEGTASAAVVVIKKP